LPPLPGKQKNQKSSIEKGGGQNPKTKKMEQERLRRCSIA